MVWILLLGVNPEEVYAESADAFSQAALQSVSDENSREQILKDVVRTRPALTLFKQEHVRNALTRLLSLFCLREKVRYVRFDEDHGHRIFLRKPLPQMSILTHNASAYFSYAF